MNTFLKNYATPLVVAIFLAIATTGLMMFFGIAAHDVHELHEWIGVTFVAVAVLHIAWNWRSLTVRLRQTRAVVVILGIVVVAGGLIGYNQFKPEEARGGGTRQIVMTLARAPIATMAPALGLTADTVVARLKARGIEADAQQSLGDIARRQNREVPGLFNAIMGGGDAD